MVSQEPVLRTVLSQFGVRDAVWVPFSDRTSKSSGGYLIEFARLRVERPLEREVGDGFPSGLTAGVVIPSGKDFVSRNRRRVLGVSFVVLPLHSHRQYVVAPARDKEQGRTVVVGEVIRRGSMVVEVCEAPLETGSAPGWAPRSGRRRPGILLQ